MTAVAEIKNNLSNSKAWLLRAVFRLNSDFAAMQSSFVLEDYSAADKLFFESLVSAYRANGDLTPQQIQLARRKMRDPYVEYLTRIANDF